MKGSSQGDFSRLRFDSGKHYSAVHMQQGRVQLDADWNEQVDILNHRLRTEALDVIGQHGAPADHPGFGIEAEWGLEVGAKRGIVTVGDRGGCRWPPAIAGDTFTLELRLLAQGPGVLYSRWVSIDGKLEYVEALILGPDGRLKLDRPGQDELLSEPVDFGSAPAQLAVACHGSEVTLYFAGQPVAQAGGGAAAATLQNNTLLLGSGYADQPPEPALEGLLFEVRLWGYRLPDELLLGHLAEPLDSAGLLGRWYFSAASGQRIVDQSSNHHDARIRRGGAPRRRPYLSITAGRYYVDGLMCENDQGRGFDQQPNHPATRQPLLAADDRAEQQLIYLEVWEREVSAIEDPQLREVALEGLTTTTRSQVVAQVKTLPVTAKAERRTLIAEVAEWAEFVAAQQQRGRLRARLQPTPSSAIDNLLYRVEIHHGTVHASATVEKKSVEEQPAEDESSSLKLDSWDDSWAAGQTIEIVAGDSAALRLRITAVDAATRTLEIGAKLVANFGDGRLAVERLATFKWSRSNGAQSYPVAHMASEVATLTPRFEGSLQDLKPGRWVELVDDASVLSGQPRSLLQVAEVDTMRREVIFASALEESTDSSDLQHPLLRAWDHGGQGQEILPSGLQLAEPGRWLEVEEGIQVLFQADASYRSGDYWVMPARTSGQNIDWLRDADGDPLAIEPHGIHRAYAPLALLGTGGGGGDGDDSWLADLRHRFQPFSRGAVSKAGDVVEGSLEVRDDLLVGGRLEVPGEAHLGDIYGRLAGREMVAGPQLAAGAVSADKLARDVGVVPDGYSILGPTTDSPPGYVCTGSSIDVLVDSTTWRTVHELPTEADGPFAGAELDNNIFILLESGDLWRYDLAADTLHRCQDLPLHKRRHGFAAVSGKLYVVGGLDAVGHCCGRTLAYDPRHDSWEEVGALPTPRCDLALVPYGDALHAFGGLRQRSILGRVVTRRHEVFDPTTDTWKRHRSLPRACCGHAATAVTKGIHIVGGEYRWLLGRWGRQQTARHLLYDPGTRRWLSERAPLPAPRRDLALVESFGRLYSIGGQGPWERIEDGWSRITLRYDPVSDHWSPITPLSEPILGPGAASIGGKLYVAGSRNAAGRHLLEESEVAQRFYLHRREWRQDETPVASGEDDTLPAVGLEDEPFPRDS